MSPRVYVTAAKTDYPLPDPNDCESEGMRFHHLDLEGMPELVLWAEGRAVDDALFSIVKSRSTTLLFTPDGFPLSARDWLHERALRIRAERKRRDRRYRGR